jgi:sugar (pentulose or hexulose) kinase
MEKINIIVIFDVGKTNKKLLLFDENYKLVQEESKQFSETKDEDGFACENVQALTHWIKNSVDTLLKDQRYEVKAVNFSAYGASLVYLDGQQNVILPLYNYLKPYEPELQRQFYDKYGGEAQVAKQTASPVLGNLNSGMQLYRLKYKKPEEFARIKYALHLPQYLSYILSSNPVSEMTSIGCHTNLWDFQLDQYHRWVIQETIHMKLAPIVSSETIAGYWQQTLPIGVGLHDSSAALIPYLSEYQEPFILLSTGTWCISLNPFNHSQLSDYELSQDCLCYLSFQKRPVKAARLFAGHEHEQEVKKLAAHYRKPLDYYSGIHYNAGYTKTLPRGKHPVQNAGNSVIVPQSNFAGRDLYDFETYEEAYHQFIFDIISQQIKSTKLVMNGGAVKKIFVDGGFSKNPIFMHYLASAFPETEVYATTVAQASALGAALSIHKYWNSLKIPTDIIKMKLYPKS